MCCGFQSCSGVSGLPLLGVEVVVDGVQVFRSGRLDCLMRDGFEERMAIVGMFTGCHGCYGKFVTCWNW